MGTPVDFPGSNFRYLPPPGREETIGDLPVFKNGRCIVSVWELDDEELAEIIRTKRVFLSSMSGNTMFPVFVGSEKTVRSVVVDTGPVWERCKHEWRHVRGYADPSAQPYECIHCGETEERDRS